MSDTINFSTINAALNDSFENDLEEVVNDSYEYTEATDTSLSEDAVTGSTNGEPSQLDSYSRADTLPANQNFMLSAASAAPANDNLARFEFERAGFSHLSPADQALFERFGQGPVAALPYDIIHYSFENYAAAQPEAVAAEHLGETITYGRLNREANRIADRLAEHGIQPGDNVGLFLQRSVPMIVGIVGTLKAGASYVPQHLGVAPESHLRYVIENAGIRVILTISRLKHLVPVPDGCVCIAIDEVMAEPMADNQFVHNPALPVSPDNTCYIIFTSGTTGKPNGVQVTHRNVCNILLTAPGDLGMRPGMRVGQILSIGFDMSAWEILGCLGNGATLVIRGKEFGPVVESVDVIIATPSVLGSFDADRCHQVQVVAVAGEPCPRPLADKWAAFCKFYNSCGPTETTIVNTAQHYRTDSEHLTIGKPTPNNTVYVLDENRKPVAIGEVGEMWAGGDCVSAGYIGNKQLTSERYALDPFLGGGRMMFRTRDLGRWTPDGELEHFGRTDDQVKIRGFRVELDSVSAVLESVPSCDQAVTLKLDSRNLVGFMRPANCDVEAAKQAVSVALPYYCMPAFIVTMDELPRTSRGKVDKRALLRMAEAMRDQDAVANDQADAVDANSADSPANDQADNDRGIGTSAVTGA